MSNPPYTSTGLGFLPIDPNQQGSSWEDLLSDVRKLAFIETSKPLYCSTQLSVDCTRPFSTGTTKSTVRFDTDNPLIESDVCLKFSQRWVLLIAGRAQDLGPLIFCRI